MQTKLAEQSSPGIRGTLKYIYLSLCALWILFPLYFLLISSLKTDDDIFLNPFGLPEFFQWQNYYTVLFEHQLIINIFNSLYYAIFGVTLTLFVGILASYALTRMNWKLKQTTFGILMTGMLVPLHSVILPLFLSVRKAGITSPRLVLIGIFAAFALPQTIFILSGFLKDIPRSLEEAAVIDGASVFKVLFKVVIPMLKPAIASLCIFNFLGIWNDLLISLIFINNDADKTLQLGILKFKGDYVTMYNYVLAAIMVAIIPTITVFLFFQKRIVAGITAGSIKG